MHGQMDTESEADAADIHMEEGVVEQFRQPPVVLATAAPTAQWPSLEDASVAEQQRRTAYK